MSCKQQMYCCCFSQSSHSIHSLNTSCPDFVERSGLLRTAIQPDLCLIQSKLLNLALISIGTHENKFYKAHNGFCMIRTDTSCPLLLQLFHFCAVWVHGRYWRKGYYEDTNSQFSLQQVLALFTCAVTVLILPSLACSVRDRKSTTKFVVHITLVITCAWLLILLYTYRILTACAIQFVLHSLSVHILFHICSSLHAQRSLLVMGDKICLLVYVSTVVVPLLFMVRPCGLPNSLAVGFGFMIGRIAFFCSNLAHALIKELGAFYEKIMT